VAHSQQKTEGVLMKAQRSVPNSLEVVSFASVRDLEQWFASNHAKSNGIWVRFFKKGSGVHSVFYDETLDAALCFGWIDGQLKKHDNESWLRKFTPRRPKSIWSKRNIERAKRLIRSGRMQPAGLFEIATAEKDGRWKAAYDPPSKMVVPSDFLEALAENPRAKAFFETLNRANRYAIAWRLQTAKRPETRKKRLEDIVAMLARGQKFHD
jgi:uncharacterized protein YdeI (YjbR/CyaY-like superfamily)